MSLPDTPFQHLDPRFRRMVIDTAQVDRLYHGCRWAEGPVWLPATQELIWSDIPNNRLMRWSEGAGAGVFRQPSHFNNGNTLDREGRIVGCLHGGRAVVRTEHDGSITTLASHWQGKRLNSPNDVVVKSDGSIWFTDPDYGINSDYEGYQAESEIGACNVYRIDGDSGDISLVSSDLERPNGLAFSTDESRLYIADTGLTHRAGGPHHIRVFDVVEGATLKGGEVFATIDPGLADGFRLDAQGNIWTSAGDGVHCYAPDGTLLGKILIPEVVSNVVFGGPRGNRLFITATTSLYAVYLAVNGAVRP
ncbi:MULTISPECIES: SMP-30/gluconolactonase/LRE family protein [Herbaspirillum]|uniref:SMP-30/gluconolactonase/LRE family protein n=1 Tax=Herbaspirillum huttiense subsp. lycopersici TaxID=3074428 RepID=A0ABU2ES84_9BURK|nr:MULTISPECIES: SMP-30/gluconolactonase/LRE family protein [Herbaspirillum]MBP1316077.1 gluconolactonase [Herbaspirillum sp. 1130]MDR9851034.1 SMP-30/gluconolactonase/LRE family protein [Herbaspirillum huttiense SE1]UWE18242.1 SMP-30/gluconolactonase/LRE family protein [Herbaspirillum huttiense]